MAGSQDKTMKQLNTKYLMAVTAVAIVSAVALAANGSRLVMNGATASTQVRLIEGKPYVPLADVARTLAMVVVKAPYGYEIKKAGGANPIQGVTQGKIGDVLFDGRWRFQVLSVELPDSYTMTSDADIYDSAGLSHLEGKTHVLQPKGGYKLVVIRCRVTNGRNSKQRLWTAISDPQVNTALADVDGGSHPPVVYDYPGANTQTNPMVAGASMTFPLIFSVPASTRPKDLIFTLHANGGEASGDTHSWNDVRVSLAR
jgi:hypothetical protein